MDDNPGRIQTRSLTIKDWQENAWKKNRLGFHMSRVNDVLLQYADLFLSKKQMSLLVPLCGKTLDMKWLYDQGHTVIGVEGVEMAVVSFFTENKIQFSVQDINAGKFKLYENEDKRLKIIVGDFLELESSQYGQPVDGIWDRGAFVAINPVERKRYVDVINKNLKSGGKILMECYEYDPSQYEGPPHNIPRPVVREFYEPFSNVEVLTSEDYLSHFGVQTLSSFDAVQYLIVKH